MLTRFSITLWLAVMGLVLAFPTKVPAQERAASKLQIIILEGDGAINNIRQRTAREPVVQVVDENRKPVAGAMVLFTLPERGAGATFSDGSRTIISYTDAQGKASARGLKPNSTAGQFQIAVNASYQGMVSTATISQVNVVSAATAGAAAGGAAGATAGISKTLIAILAVAAGAAATGAVVATRGNSPASVSAPPSPGAPPPVPSITINPPGTASFGPPQ